MFPDTHPHYPPYPLSFTKPEQEKPYVTWDSAPTSPTTWSTASSTSGSVNASPLEDNDVKRIFCAGNTINHTNNADPRHYRGVSPDLSSPMAALPDDDPNPLAKPFVPHNVPKSRRLQRPDPGSMLPSRMPKWKRNFALATRPPIMDNELHSVIVVAAGRWDPEQMAELAQELCWRLVEVPYEELDAVLAFLLRLQSRFRQIKAEDTADSFDWHLKEYVLGTFVSVWDAKSNLEAISYNSAPNAEYVHSAIQLAGVIGEMYARGCLDVKNIADCLEILTANSVSIEHIDAIANLIHRAGFPYWSHRQNGHIHLEMFRRVFSNVVVKLRGHMSVLRRPRSDESLDKVLRSVDNCCREWMAELATRVTLPAQLPRLPPPPQVRGQAGRPENLPRYPPGLDIPCELVRTS